MLSFLLKGQCLDAIGLVKDPDFPKDGEVVRVVPQDLELCDIGPHNIVLITFHLDIGNNYVGCEMVDYKFFET